MTWGSKRRKRFVDMMMDIGKIALAGMGVAPFVQSGHPAGWLVGAGLAVAAVCFCVALLVEKED